MSFPPRDPVGGFRLDDRVVVHDSPHHGPGSIYFHGTVAGYSIRRMGDILVTLDNPSLHFEDARWNAYDHRLLSLESVVDTLARLEAEP